MYIFDDVGSCLESGNVWDHNQKICRDNCLFWHKSFGCIPLKANDCAEKNGIWDFKEKKCLYTCASWVGETDCSDKNKPFWCHNYTEEWDKNWKNCRKECGAMTKEVYCPSP